MHFCMADRSPILREQFRAKFKKAGDQGPGMWGLRLGLGTSDLKAKNLGLGG